MRPQTRGPGIRPRTAGRAYLGWTLATRVAGWSPEGLLDSRHAEQREVTADVLTTSRAGRTAVRKPGPQNDLSTDFIGTDARKYDTSSCSAVIPSEASDVPTLLSGGTASFQVCMDVPPTAIEGGQVEMSESFSFDDVSAVWATR